MLITLNNADLCRASEVVQKMQVAFLVDRCLERTSNEKLSVWGAAAMTMTNASPPPKGRRIKFTSQVIEQIKESVAAGISRDEIANRVGVTVGSLQVTCSRLGISLRRIILPNGSGRHMPDVRGSVCRQSISDSWLGNLRECLAHLV
jgi:hypothetical protein